MIALIYCAGILVIGGGLLLVLSLAAPWMSIADVQGELVKVAIQVVVFGLVGGGVKLLLDRQSEYRKFRSDLLDRLGRAHKDVYRVRRLLPQSKSGDAQQLLADLMNARQDLGAAYHTARVWGLAAKIDEIRRHTETMRSYLEGVICGAFAAEGTPERALYAAFLDWGTPGAYETTFKKSYFAAKALVDPSFSPRSRENVRVEG